MAFPGYAYDLSFTLNMVVTFWGMLLKINGCNNSVQSSMLQVSDLLAIVVHQIKLKTIYAIHYDHLEHFFSTHPRGTMRAPKCRLCDQFGLDLSSLNMKGRHLHNAMRNAPCESTCGLCNWWSTCICRSQHKSTAVTSGRIKWRS